MKAHCPLESEGNLERKPGLGQAQKIWAKPARWLDVLHEFEKSSFCLGWLQELSEKLVQKFSWAVAHWKWLEKNA